MQSSLRPLRRGQKLAAAVVLVAGFAARETSAEVAAPDPLPGSPTWWSRVAAPVAAWAVPAVPVQTLDPSATFESRLDHEARRRGALGIVALDPDDDAAAKGRSESAQKIFTRALRGLMNDQAESLARGMPGFGDALRWLDGFDLHASGGAPSRAAAPRAEELAGAGLVPGANAAPGRPSPFDAGLRMRLDAHPRVELRARAGTLTGLIEVPLLEHEIRFGLEQPLGRLGKAAIRGGRSAEQGDWADLVVGIRF
jgi:hypothetical protein